MLLNSIIREFFVNENPIVLYKPFGFIHLLFIFLCFIATIIIYHNRNKISKISRKNIDKILKTCAVILLLNMIIYTFGNLYYGSFDYKEMLPFHLCFIANYMFIYAILFNKESILKITLFMSFIGPIPAILWPDLVSTIDNYNFWQLIISHHFFLNVSLFSYYSLNYSIKKNDIHVVFIFLNTILLISYPLNKSFNTNYIFTNYIPDNVLELYPFLDGIPALLILEIVGMIILFLTYKLVINNRNKELSKNNLQ